MGSKTNTKVKFWTNDSKKAGRGEMKVHYLKLPTRVMTLINENDT